MIPGIATRSAKDMQRVRSILQVDFSPTVMPFYMGEIQKPFIPEQ